MVGVGVYRPQGEYGFGVKIVFFPISRDLSRGIHSSWSCLRDVGRKKPEMLVYNKKDSGRKSRAHNYLFSIILFDRSGSQTEIIKKLIYSCSCGAASTVGVTSSNAP